MDAALAINAMVNGNLSGMLDALDASETYTVTGVGDDGRTVPLGQILVIGSTTVEIDPQGGIRAHGHATDAEASECAEINAIRLATLGQLAEGGSVRVTDSDGNLAPAASVETARLLAFGFPVPPEVFVAEAQALRNAEAPARVAALPLTLGAPGTMDGPPVPPTGMYL